MKWRVAGNGWGAARVGVLQRKPRQPRAWLPPALLEESVAQGAHGVGRRPRAPQGVSKTGSQPPMPTEPGRRLRESSKLG